MSKFLFGIGVVALPLVLAAIAEVCFGMAESPSPKKLEPVDQYAKYPALCSSECACHERR